MANRRSASYSKATSKSAKWALKEGFTRSNGSRPSTDLLIDAAQLELVGHQIKTYTKQLYKLKDDIVRKRKKSKSKYLADCEDEYDVTYTYLIETIKQLNTLLPGNDSGRGDTGGFDSCRECDRKQLKIWKLENDMKKQPSVDPGKHDIDLRRAERQQPSVDPGKHDIDLRRAERQQPSVDPGKHDIDLRRAERQISELQQQVSRLKSQLAEESASKEDAIRRLSELASSKLRDNNPNIADLSDANRPTKLAEQVSELYDNEWTDAFDEMETTSRYSERELIDLLLKAFMNIFDECKRKTTTGFFESVQSCIEQSDMIQVTKDNRPVAIPDQLRQQIKDFRKIRAVKTMANVVEGILKRSRFDYFQKPPYNSEKARAYLEKCVELSWMMCVQDPPLVLSVQAPNEFNTALFREYTKRGRYTAYVVWPILYLHDGGPILCKGVAQGSNDYNMDVGYSDPKLKSRTGMSTDMIDTKASKTGFYNDKPTYASVVSASTYVTNDNYQGQHLLQQKSGQAQAQRNTGARIEYERTPPPAGQTFNTNWTGASKHGVSMVQTQYQPRYFAGNQQHASYGNVRDNNRYSSLNATHYPQVHRNTNTARSPANQAYVSFQTDI